MVKFFGCQRIFDFSVTSVNRYGPICCTIGFSKSSSVRFDGFVQLYRYTSKFNAIGGFFHILNVLLLGSSTNSCHKNTIFKMKIVEVAKTTLTFANRYRTRSIQNNVRKNPIMVNATPIIVSVHFRFLKCIWQFDFNFSFVSMAICGDKEHLKNLKKKSTHYI